MAGPIDRMYFSVGPICQLKDSGAYKGEWYLSEVCAVYPDDHGKVRYVQVLVKANQGVREPYMRSNPAYLNPHTYNLILLIPVEEGMFSPKPLTLIL